MKRIFEGNFGILTLEINDDGTCTGSYQKEGSLTGKLENEKFEGQWKNKEQEGLVNFEIKDGKLSGGWKKGLEKGAMRGKWNGTEKSATTNSNLSPREQELIQKIESNEFGRWNILEKIPEEDRSIPVLIAAVKVDSNVFDEVTDEVRANKTFVLAALSDNASLLEKAEAFWDDKEIVLGAFKAEPITIGMALIEEDIRLGETLAADKEFEKACDEILQNLLAEASAAYTESRKDHQVEVRKILSYKNNDKEAKALNEINKLIILRQTAGTELEWDTQLCLQQIEDETFRLENRDGEEFSWEDVSPARLTHDLLKKKKAISTSMFDEDGTFWFDLLKRVSEENPAWAAAIVDKLQANILIGVWGGDSWEPRVLWNGVVLIRNHHRVVGFQFKNIILLSKEQQAQVLEDIDRVEEAEKWIVTAHNKMIKSTEKASEINLYGNNMFGVIRSEALEGSTFLTPDLLEDIFEESRVGPAFRLFEGGMAVYSTHRDQDELDFALENLCAYMGEDETDLDWVCYRQFSNDPEESKKLWAAYEKKEHDFFYDVLTQRFEDSQDWDEYSFAEEHKIEAYNNKDIRTLLAENVANTMYSKVRAQFVWKYNIFSDEENTVHSYTHYPPEFLQKMREGNNPAMLVLRHLYVEDVEGLDALEDLSELTYLIERFGGNIDNYRAEVFIPGENDDDEGEWVDFDQLSRDIVAEYKERMTMLIDREMDGDWEEAGEVTDGNFLRIFFTFEQGELLDVRDFGQRISEALEDEDFEFPTGGGINLEFPAMGLFQSYDGGDLDSGNMHE